MAKDPIFPLYYNDLDRSTKTWTDEEFGAYVRLLMEQWDKGFIPKDYQRLTRIATSLDKNWPMLKQKFVEVDGNLQNLRLEDIRLKKSKFKEKQRDNVLKRYQNSTKPPTKKLPLEIENENESEKEKELLISKTEFSTVEQSIHQAMMHTGLTPELAKDVWEAFKAKEQFTVFEEMSHLNRVLHNFIKKNDLSHLKKKPPAQPMQDSRWEVEKNGDEYTFIEYDGYNKKSGRTRKATKYDYERAQAVS